VAASQSSGQDAENEEGLGRRLCVYAHMYVCAMQTRFEKIRNGGVDACSHVCMYVDMHAWMHRYKNVKDSDVRCKRKQTMQTKT
jgi:hypothetical protein